MLSKITMTLWGHFITSCVYQIIQHYGYIFFHVKNFFYEINSFNAATRNHEVLRAAHRWMCLPALALKSSSGYCTQCFGCC